MLDQLKTLSADEIECLLGIRSSDAHPLDILGYGYSSEGARRFRAEQPDFLPQIAAHVRSVLAREGIFPKGTDPDNAGYKTFIRTDGASFWISSMEEVGFSRFERFSTGPMSEKEAICEYIQQVANPDYIRSA
jgi:hypothetical protein